MAARPIVDVHIMLVRDDAVLLSLRRGEYGDGQWHLPSGKLEQGEDILTAAARETTEEVGVLVCHHDLDLVHTVHAHDPGGDARLGLFFLANRWQGDPVNREPDKCYRIGWFPHAELPEPLIPYPAAGIHGYRRGTALSVLGWSPPQTPAPDGRASTLRTFTP